MLESWVFMVALLLVSTLFLFHGLVLLIAPHKYLPQYEWGNPSKLELRRKPPLYMGRRFAGLCIAVLVAKMFVRPAIHWILHPAPATVSWGESLLPRGMVRWDLLALGILAIGIGYYLVRRPETSVRLMFTADEGKLSDKSTRRL